MCFSFIIEQALAQRIPNASIWLAILPNAHTDLTPENKAEFEHYVSHFYRLDEQHKLTITHLMKAHSLKRIPDVNLD